MNENQNEYVDINAHDNYPDSEQKIEIPTMKVIPLKKICMTIGALPTSYLETLSYYEMLIWFIEFLKNNIIPTINNNASAIQEVQSVVLALQKYINNYKDSIDSDVEELEEYMNNYFENLDVQEEINNKLEQMLEDGVLEQIIEQFIQSSTLWCFDTVNDMKLSTNLIVGSYAKTLGFNSKNDGGGAIYYISDTGTANEMNIISIGSLYAILSTPTVLTPEMFGAYGDDTHDDTDSINACIEYGHVNQRPIHLLGKTYAIYGKITINAGDYEQSYGAKIYGDNTGGCIINVKDELTNIIEVTGSSSTVNGFNVELSNITIFGNNLATNGLIFKDKSIAGSTFENLFIYQLTGSGITQSASNIFLNTFNKIRCEQCDVGINLRTNINTSNNIENCYMVNCRIGYSIKSIYSDLLNCCADGITETVFDMYYYSGNIINPGSESPSAINVFKFFNSTAQINGGNTFGNFTNENAIHIVCSNHSNVTFTGCKLLTYNGAIYNDGTHIASGYLYSTSSYGYLQLINCQYSDYQKEQTSSEHTESVSIDNGYGQVSLRNGKSISFIGNNTVLYNGLVNPACKGSTLSTNAIYLGLGNNIRYTSNGTDLRWTRHTMKGDLLLSQSPEDIGGIGWIQAEQPATTSGWETGKYLKIPVIMSGETDSRPTTSLVVGQMYFDTSLNKPIWYKGSSTWVDATGTTV